MARKRKNFSIELEGAAEVDKALRQLKDRAAGKTLKEAAEAGAEVIREAASDKAPRKSGKLAENIIVQPKSLQIGRAQIDIGPSKVAWYGRLVELGTKHMPAKPFLRPAFDEKREEAVEAVKEILRKALGLK